MPSKPEAKTPTETEATGEETITVQWRDLDFQVPAERLDWPFEAALSFEQGRYLDGMAELLTAEQFRAFRDTRPTARDGMELLNAILRAFGLPGLGERSASSD